MRSKVILPPLYQPPAQDPAEGEDVLGMPPLAGQPLALGAEAVLVELAVLLRRDDGYLVVKPAVLVDRDAALAVG